MFALEKGRSTSKEGFIFYTTNRVDASRIFKSLKCLNFFYRHADNKGVNCSAISVLKGESQQHKKMSKTMGLFVKKVTSKTFYGIRTTHAK